MSQPYENAAILHLQGLIGRRWELLLAIPRWTSVLEHRLTSLLTRNRGLARRFGRWKDGHDTAKARASLAVDLGRTDRYGRIASQLVRDLEAESPDRTPVPTTALHRLQRMSREIIAERNALITTHWGLLRLAVSRMRIPAGRRDDMVQEGVFGLVRALEGYDPDRGTKFSTYAMFWIRNTLVASMARYEHEIRIPANVLANRRAYARCRGALDVGQSASSLREQAREAAGLTERQLRVVESTPDSKAPSGAEARESNADLAAQLERERLLQGLAGAWSSLSTRERTVLEHRFELGDRSFQTLEQLGERLGSSREWVRQLQLSALDKLRDHLDVDQRETAA